MKKILALILTLMLMCACLGASAEAKYPVDTVEIIITASAGGDIDFMARTFAEKLSERWGVNVIVTNAGSANTAATLYRIKDGKGDGSQVMLYQTNLPLYVAQGTVDFKLEDLKYSACLGQLPGYVIVVRGDSGITTLEELKEAALAKPGELIFGMTNGGSTAITANMLEAALGVDFNMVDVGTSSDKVVSLLGGHCNVTTIPYGNAKPYVESGDFVVLGTLGNDPNPMLPEFKACGEMGIDTEYSIKYGFIFGSNTPDELIAMWDKEIVDIIENDEDYAKRLAESYFETPYTCSSQELLDYYNSMIPIIEKYLLN